MKKTLKSLLLTGLFLTGSAAVMMACDEDEPPPAEKPYVETESHSSVVPDSLWQKETINEPGAKLISLNHGTINFAYGDEGFTHTYYTATFKMPNKEFSLLLPFPKEIILNRRYDVKYETFNPAAPFTVKNFTDRFIRYRTYIVEALNDRPIDSNLDGMIRQIGQSQTDLR